MSPPPSLNRIAPQSGTGFALRKGQILRVTDPQGEQVSDLYAVSARDARAGARPLAHGWPSVRA